MVKVEWNVASGYGIRLTGNVAVLYLPFTIAARFVTELANVWYSLQHNGDLHDFSLVFHRKLKIFSCPAKYAQSE